MWETAWIQAVFGGTAIDNKRNRPKRPLGPKRKGGPPMEAGHLIANGAVRTPSFLHDGGGKQPWEMAAVDGKTNRMKAKKKWGEL